MDISIPYGAIKRLTGKNNYLEFSKIFQFLMVRLKACLFFQAKDTFRQFQFLMVRLKVFKSDGRMLSESISIPYGAIKSAFNMLVKMGVGISIPYGAIKS